MCSDNCAVWYASYICNACNRLTDTLVQVLTVMQQALCVVKGFPYIADTARTLEVLAGTRREPPSILLTQPLGQDDFEHKTTWQRVVNYLKAVNKDNLHLHVPFATEP